MQLQALGGIMKRQFSACPSKELMIMGAAGGNGLSEKLMEIHFAEALREEQTLPNGKKLLRLDFERVADRGKDL